MKRRVWFTIAFGLALSCADDSAKSISAGDGDNSARGNNDATNAQNAEVEQEFEFAQPAVVGPNVFVANESLNSVAVIDSRSLAIRTVPVGFKPTLVVGPSTLGEASRVWVLNEGSSSVSIVDPATLEVVNAPVLRGSNTMAASPDGTWALTWVDGDALAAGGTARDLSAATLVRADGAAFQLATGFGIERVAFAGSTALILTDDGVSVVSEPDITGDSLVAPVAALPPDLQQLDRADREVALDPDGEWMVARVSDFAGVVLTELATGEQWVAALPGVPTDLDWIAGDPGRVLVMVRGADVAVVATVPDGLMGLPDVMEPVSEDMGPADMGAPDMADMPDMGSDMATDTGVPDADMAPPVPTMPVAGVWILPLDEPGLGAAEVAPQSTNALLFSTSGEERRGTLLDLATLQQRALFFEKGVRGAIANEAGTRYLVLHTKQNGEIPPDASPSDPEYIARSWGLSIVDVATTATRLVLTHAKPGAVTIWAAEPSERVYMIFEEGTSTDEALRDVLRVDLESFSTATFRVPSFPEGIGRIDDAGRIYVNQKHPQGRLTFVDVANDRRQTVTGYQLNAGID